MQKRYYNVNNVSYYDEKTNKWVYGNDAIKHMKCIKSDDGNWDLYLDKDSGIIYYVAVVQECYSGIWGDIKYFKRRYGRDIPV